MNYQEKLIKIMMDGVFRSQEKLAEMIGVDGDTLRIHLFKIKGLHSKTLKGTHSTIKIYGL